MTKKKKEIKMTEEQLKYIYGKDWDSFTEEILPNCFCPCAGGNTTIIDYEIFLNDLNDIELKGKCARCGGAVGRYVETGEVEEYGGRIKKFKLN